MLNPLEVRNLEFQPRSISIADTSDAALGPLSLLPGIWRNLPNLPGRGWNMIALPFATGPASPFNFRLLLNQYNEELKFTSIDGPVPNRGIAQQDGTTVNADQFLFALDYEQTIIQIASEDSPVSGLAGLPNIPIHHEPGLWLHLTNGVDDDLDLARLATIPHGDSVMALGRHSSFPGPPVIPAVNGLPVGVNQDLASPYLAPYKQFHDNPFLGLFDPVNPHLLLAAANAGVNIVKTTELEVDTTFATGGIVNIPFIVKQANATEMKAKFWIQELSDTDATGKPKMRLQYLQTVFLDFFPRPDGLGMIRWPHVSINTLEKS